MPRSRLPFTLLLAAITLAALPGRARAGGGYSHTSIGGGLSVPRAGDADDDGKPAVIELAVVTGFATPVGAIGIEAQIDISHWLGLSFGAGGGASGAQLAFMPRLRAGSEGDGFSFYAGAGVSGGPYEAPNFCYGSNCGDQSGVAIWGNAEVGLQYDRGAGGIRLFAGTSTILNDHPARGAGVDSLPYAGLALVFRP
jgi:hypothetical protein